MEPDRIDCPLTYWMYVVGGMITGGLSGAAVGTCIFPILGTIIGAGVGFFVGLVGGVISGIPVTAAAWYATDGSRTRSMILAAGTSVGTVVIGIWLSQGGGAGGLAALVVLCTGAMLSAYFASLHTTGRPPSRTFGWSVPDCYFR